MQYTHFLRGNDSITPIDKDILNCKEKINEKKVRLSELKSSDYIQLDATFKNPSVSVICEVEFVGIYNLDSFIHNTRKSACGKFLIQSSVENKKQVSNRKRSCDQDSYTCAE